MAETPLAVRIDAALPQTQCTRCGYPDCRHYAEAIAAGSAGINQCPPGGAQGIARLAQITRQAVVPLSAQHGVEGPRLLAVIDEAWCIGCTLCIEACPVDCIAGSHKRMHTVIEALCTGCELCVPVCPVDCIALENASGPHTGWAAWSAAQADEARARYGRHVQRNTREQRENEQRLAGAATAEPGAPTSADPKRALIDAAMARARAQREVAGR
jgi:Na+-translocating ferredoxin:NAD+ oxidoreductase subunit B